jgi:hypothetical protein
MLQRAAMQASIIRTRSHTIHMRAQRHAGTPSSNNSEPNQGEVQGKATTMCTPPAGQSAGRGCSPTAGPTQSPSPRSARDGVPDKD